MFRAFLGNILYGFRRDALKTAASLLAIFQTHPVVMFQTVVLLRFPTIAGVAMFVLGSLANHLLVNIIFRFRGARMWMLLHREAVDTFSGFTFRSVTADQYLDGADYADMDFWLVKKFRGTSSTLNNTIRVHVLRKPGAVVANLASFSMPPFDAQVFLTDGPESLRGIRRFQVLHEIGHALLRMATSTAFIEVGLAPGIFFLCWFASTTERTVHALAVALACTAVLIIWRSEIHRQQQVARLISESAADGLAVSYLSPEDCRAAASSPFLPYLKDRELSELHNAVRLARLRAILEMRASGDDDRAFELFSADLPRFTLDTSLPAILLFGVMGVYGTVPTGETAAWAGALTCGLLLVFLFLATLEGYFHGALLHQLELRGVASGES